MGTRLALARQLQTYPCFHAGRNLHREGPIGPRPPRAPTVAASMFDDTPLASTGRTGLADREKALRVPNLAAAAAGTAGGWGCPGLCAAPLAGAAWLQPGDRNLFLYSEDRFL